MYFLVTQKKEHRKFRIQLMKLHFQIPPKSEFLLGIHVYIYAHNSERVKLTSAGFVVAFFLRL